eukprot:CAMPEP_0183717022 /NCGR_PEP_ID=MMETSP0737-20130205/10729_1 /TAXON_ID=385413 /ORGANISM="Thalassiosira miniscula, Strain CCMP1093" /LENGTH=325 /DNA_ID=CAMNT_0025946375 /DNA_START=544 /DNA_END=1518 /DNA_ORIENTATION=+
MSVTNAAPPNASHHRDASLPSRHERRVARTARAGRDVASNQPSPHKVHAKSMPLHSKAQGRSAAYTAPPKASYPRDAPLPSSNGPRVANNKAKLRSALISRAEGVPLHIIIRGKAAPKASPPSGAISPTENRIPSIDLPNSGGVKRCAGISITQQYTAWWSTCSLQAMETLYFHGILPNFEWNKQHYYSPFSDIGQCTEVIGEIFAGFDEKQFLTSPNQLRAKAYASTAYAIALDAQGLVRMQQNRQTYFYEYALEIVQTILAEGKTAQQHYGTSTNATRHISAAADMIARAQSSVLRRYSRSSFPTLQQLRSTADSAATTIQVW